VVDPLLRAYYDEEWGMPIRDERGLYERICLEGFQAGLSWLTVLSKRPAFRRAFEGFDPDRVAAFDRPDIERLLADEGIVRNRRKIEAAVTNARATLALRGHGGLAELIWSFQPDVTPEPRTLDEVPTMSEESKALAAALRGRGFVFVGPTTMYALMEAVGIIDTHLVDSYRRGSSGVWPTPAG
jgi:DNA-3-methyladenine glycosylase I